MRIRVKKKGMDRWKCGKRASCLDFAELNSRHPELQDNIERLQKHGAADLMRHRTPANIWEKLKKGQRAAKNFLPADS